MLVAGTMEEVAAEVGTAVSSATQDPGFSALGGRVRVRVGVGIGAADRSVLPVAMCPIKTNINVKL